MPSSFLLDKEGKVHALHRGFKGEESVKEYSAEIESLLK
jgi:peroxiredoxin